MDAELKMVIAGFFWEIGAIKVSVDQPFKLTSGKTAPIYIDCRMLISFPLQRDVITAYARQICLTKQLSFDYIAGGETAGMPFAAWLAAKMSQPYIYVRKKPKGHGTGAQLEGSIEKGASVLLYEDLITDGGSKISFIEGIRNDGCTVSDCLVVLDRIQGGDQLLKQMGVTLHSLVTMDDCLLVGRDRKFLSEAEFEIVENYLQQTRKKDSS